MKDKELRNALIRTGIIDEDCWGREDSFKNMREVASWFRFSKDKESNEVKVLKNKLSALLEHLNLEEVYVSKKPSSYKFTKKKAKK